MPAVSPRVVHIPAGLPIDESTRPEILDAGQANLSNVNVRMNKRGGLDKRLGFGALASTRLGASARTSGRRLFAHKGVPTVIDSSSELDSYSELGSTNVTRTRVPECSYRLVDLPVPSASSVVTDSEVCAGYAAIAYQRTLSGAGYVAIVEAETGTVVASPALLDAGYTDPAFILLTSFSGRYFVAFLQTLDINGEVRAYRLDTQNISAGWTLIEQVSATTSGAFSVCSLSDRVVVAYGTTSGTNRVTVKTYNTAGTPVGSTTIATSSASPTHVDVHGSTAGTLWVVWNQTTTVKGIGLSPSTLAVVSTATTVTTFPGFPPVDLRVCEGTAGTARVMATTSNQLSVKVVDLTTLAGATTTSVAVVLFNLQPSVRPWFQGGRFYIGCYSGITNSDYNPQAHLIVVDWTENEGVVRPVANIEPGLVLSAAYNTFGKASPISSTKVAIAFQVAKAGEVSSGALGAGATNAGAQLLILDYAARDRWQSVSHAGVTFLSGALLSIFDGERVTEAGILVRPTEPEVATEAPALVGITGTFRYVATYEDVDSAGNWVISGVSDPSDTVSPSGEDVTVSVKPLTISSRLARGAARLVIYRTVDGAEPPYYRLTAVELGTSPSADVTYTDSTPDSDLFDNAQLFAPSLPGTNGGPQNRLAPPGLTTIVSYNGMLAGARGNTVFFSGQHIPGEGVWFNPIFQVPIEDDEGDVTGLAAQDGTIYAFKRRSTFSASGEAPSDNGAAGGIGSFRRLAADVGCIDQNSIVVTSLGVFFQSERGIELLNRGGAIVWIGEKIQSTLANYPIVTSATIDDRNSLVRFTLAEGTVDGVVSGEGRDVIFDLTINDWISMDDRRGSSAHEAAQDAAVVTVGGEQRYAWLGADGTVYVERDDEDSNACLDGTSFVTAQYEIPQLKMGLQQEQRVYDMMLLFERHSAAGITIEVSHDGGAYAAVTTDKVWAEAATLGQRQLEFKPKPRGSSIGLRIRDTAPVVLGTGKGFTFIGVSADIAPIQGATRGTPRLATSLRR